MFSGQRSLPNGNGNLAPSVWSISNRIVATYKLRFAHSFRVNNYHSEISRQFCQVFVSIFPANSDATFFSRITISKASGNLKEFYIPKIPQIACKFHYRTVAALTTARFAYLTTNIAQRIPASSRLSQPSLCIASQSHSVRFLHGADITYSRDLPSHNLLFNKSDSYVKKVFSNLCDAFQLGMCSVSAILLSPWMGDLSLTTQIFPNHNDLLESSSLNKGKDFSDNFMATKSDCWTIVSALLTLARKTCQTSNCLTPVLATLEC